MWASAGFFLNALTLCVVFGALVLAWLEHVASHPPKIRVSQIDIDVENWAKTGALGSAHIFAYNDGGSTARIEGVAKRGAKRGYASLVFYVGKHPPIAKPFEIDNEAHKHSNPFPPTHTKLTAGDGFWWPITDRGMISDAVLRTAVCTKSTQKLFIIGRIHYCNWRGNMMHTIFCREYDKTKRRFVLSDYPEFENFA